MLKGLLSCFFLLGVLSAQIVEYSPSANALSGISLLSDSVSDIRLSPVMAKGGIASYYHRLFNIPDITVFGFTTAARLKHLTLAGGSSYLNHPDYNAHNPYFNLCYSIHGLSLGTTGHLEYDSVKDAGARYLFCWDLGAAYTTNFFAAEFKTLRINTSDARKSLSLKLNLNEDISTAVALVHDDGVGYSYRVGTNTALHEYLNLFSSWQNDPHRFGLGLCLNLESWCITYSIRSHPQLDLSHSLGLELPL